MAPPGHSQLEQRTGSEQGAAGPPCAPSAPLADPQGLVHARVDRIPGFLGSFTAAAVVDAPPDKIFRFLSSPAEFPSVYSSCSSVEELRHEAAPSEGGNLPALTFVMRSVVTVLGLTQKPAMLLRMEPDAARGQVRFCQLQPSGMVSGMEGVNAVLPLPAGADLAGADLAAQLAGATEAFLHAQGVPMQAAQAAEPQFASLSRGLLAHLLCVPRPVPSTAAGAAAGTEQQPQRSIVIMHQKTKLKFCPPGVGAMVRAQILSSHTRNLSDLLSCFMGGKAAALRSSGAEELEVRT
ncbi:hypothetical protein ABPG75_013496 [Micractinium tetrahymenae]